MINVLCSGLRWLKWWIRGNCHRYLLKDIMQLVGKERLYVGFSRRYVEPGRLLIILYSCGGLISGKNYGIDNCDTFSV